MAVAEARGKWLVLVTVGYVPLFPPESCLFQPYHSPSNPIFGSSSLSMAARLAISDWFIVLGIICRVSTVVLEGILPLKR